jgi:hypothetical protein
LSIKATSTAGTLSSWMNWTVTVPSVSSKWNQRTLVDTQYINDLIAREQES